MIYYLPLENIDMRYTTHLDRDIRLFLRGYEHRIIEPAQGSTVIENGSFLDAGFTIMTKSKQMYEIAELYRNNIIQDGDIIFTSDIWFTGIESIAYLNYFYKKKVKLRGVVHAGSFTDTDFVRDMERWAKYFEDIVFDIAEKIFVASNFISDDILKKRIIQKEKLIVTGLPMDYLALDIWNCDTKQDIVIFNGRNVDEKQPHLFERLEERLPNYRFFNTHKLNLPKKQYYDLLSISKVVVSFALQENFGYGIQEAVYLKNVPVVPNRLVYKEQFDKQYRYDDFEDCVRKVEMAIKDKLPVPKLKLNTNESIFKEWFLT